MSASRFEVRGIALGDLMKVDGVLSGSEILESEMNFDAVSFLLDVCGSDHGSGGILKDNALGGYVSG
jgi:hypothetical protein